MLRCCNVVFMWILGGKVTQKRSLLERSLHVAILRSVYVTMRRSIHVTMPRSIYVSTLRSFNVTILRSFHVTTLRSTYVTTLRSIYVTVRRRIHVTTRRINYVAELRSMDVARLRKIYVLVLRWRNVALLCRCDVIWTVLVLSPLLAVCRPTAWASTPVLRSTIYVITGTKMYQWSIVERGTCATALHKLLDGKQQAGAKARQRFKITCHLQQQKRRLCESGEQLARVVLVENRSVRVCYVPATLAPLRSKVLIKST